jgi:glycine betaine/proline transport system ATP-binding protein
LIEVQHLTKVFSLPEQRAVEVIAGDHVSRETVADAGGLLAVHDVSFTVEQGELFVIMGLSGSGKSTLIRMINRLVTPTAGSVRVDGADVAQLDDAGLRSLRNKQISMVFQHFALFPHRSIRENVAYGLKVRGVPERERLERAAVALEQVGLTERGDAYPDQLSGGMKQRVGLARALATDADVLLMDEPFSALDPLIRRDMQNLLLQLQDEFHKTILFVTHDLNEAMRIGDRIMVMKDGSVVQLGTGPDIIAAPATDYVRKFVADIDKTRVLTAESIMRPPLLTATVDSDPRSVLHRLENAEANGVYVLDEHGGIVGVGRDDLLAKAVGDGDRTLARCLVDEFRCVAPEAPLVDLFPIAGHNIVPVAVVDEEHRLLGVVPRAAILSALATQEDGPDGQPDWLPSPLAKDVAAGEGLGAECQTSR